MTPEIPAPLPRPAGPQGPATENSAVPAALWPRHPRPGRPQVWLPAAAGGLGVLAGAAATVSYAAQYRLVDAARHLALAAALEAAIPDAAALVFACLGVALALHGRRAVRARRPGVRQPFGANQEAGRGTRPGPAPSARQRVGLAAGLTHREPRHRP
jgi:hypothetical protein